MITIQYLFLYIFSFDVNLAWYWALLHIDSVPGILVICDSSSIFHYWFETIIGDESSLSLF